MRRLLALLAWLLAAPAALGAGVELEARVWPADLGGVARADGAGDGTTIDLAADLGIAEDGLAGARLVWRPSRRTWLRLSYASFDFAGDARIDRELTFAGTTFQLDAQVVSRLGIEYGGVGFAWQPISSADGRLRLGPLVEARGLRGEASLRAELLGGLLPLAAREEVEVAFATAGLALDVEPSRRLHLSAEWRTSVTSGEGELTDAEAAVRFYPIDSLAIAAGYRRLTIDARSGGDLFDLELDGPFFGAVLRF